MKTKRKILGVVLLCCGVALSLFIFQRNSTNAQDNEYGDGREPLRTSPEPEGRRGGRNRGDSQRRPGSQDGAPRDSGSDSNEGFYRVIVENNLFRPLGWTQPNTGPDYVLAGTWVASNGRRAKALVMERRSNKAYYVSPGEKVGNATVEKIAPNQVTLNTSGKVLTLKADSIQFLNVSGGSSGGPSGGPPQGPPPQQKGGEGKVGNPSGPGENQPNFEQMQDRLRNASPEERRQMIEQFRQRGGGGGGNIRIERR